MDNNWHLMDRSGIQEQQYFIFEYAENPARSNRSYFFSSSAFEGVIIYLPTIVL